MKRSLMGALTAGVLAFGLLGCTQKLFVKSYDIENSQGPYTRIRIDVPSAGSASGAEIRLNYSGTSARTAVIDPSNILAIVQNEVMRSLQASGHQVKLVLTEPDLDLQLSFEPPTPRCDLLCWVTFQGMPIYESIGGAKLVDGATGNILAAFEISSSIRRTRNNPPSQIKDWDKYAQKLASEVKVQLEKLKLAENNTLQTHGQDALAHAGSQQ